MRDRVWLGKVGLVCLAGVWLLAGGGRIGAQGRYAEVTEADVVALKLNHYFGTDRKYRAPDFEWSFTRDEFVLRKAKGAIPADLLEKLLPAGTSADEVRGKWKLEGKDGKKLVLTEIKAGEVAGKSDVRLGIYRTAPTVIRVGEPQYVFAVRR